MNSSVVNRCFKFVSGSIRCINICVQAVISHDEDEQRKILLTGKNFERNIVFFFTYYF